MTGLADSLPYTLHLGPRQAHRLRVGLQLGQLDGLKEGGAELETEADGVGHLVCHRVPELVDSPPGIHDFVADGVAVESVQK